MIPIINLDIDNTLADWTGYLIRMAGLPLEAHEMVTYDPFQTIPDEYVERAEFVLNAPNFYNDLPLLPGARILVRRLQGAGAMVNLVSTPASQQRWYDVRKGWLRFTLGVGDQRLYPAYDKSVIFGHVFVDDNVDHVTRWQAMWKGMGTAFLMDAPANRRAVVTDIERIYLDEARATALADRLLSVAREHASDPRWADVADLEDML